MTLYLLILLFGTMAILSWMVYRDTRPYWSLKKPGNRKMDPDEAVDRRLATARAGLLTLPPDDQQLILRAFQNTIDGLLLMHGKAPATVQSVQKQYLTPKWNLVALVDGQRAKAKYN